MLPGILYMYYRYSKSFMKTVNFTVDLVFNDLKQIFYQKYLIGHFKDNYGFQTEK